MSNPINATVFSDLTTALTAINTLLTNIEAGQQGVTDTVMGNNRIYGKLSDAGAGVDYEFGAADYTTPVFFSWAATVPTAIHRMVLSMTLGDVDETTLKDANLWLGGTTALTNGIKWGTSVSSTFASNTCVSTKACAVEDFGTVWGAEVFRDINLESGTNTVNHDHILVVLDFPKIHGAPIILAASDYIGIYLADDLRTVLTNGSGAVFGRKVV